MSKTQKIINDAAMEIIKQVKEEERTIWTESEIEGFRILLNVITYLNRYRDEEA